MGKKMNKETKAEFINFLKKYVQKERQEKFKKVLNERTKYITVVLEDIHHPHNASAVIRSCDCFGIQNAHIIENKYEYDINPFVVKGASKWVNIKKYNKEKNNTLNCINKLKEDGYRIIATSPHASDKDLGDLDLSAGKVALVFGTEETGISNIVKENADEFIKIPMVGFTESFNISVCAAICLNELSNKARKEGINFKLTEEEKAHLTMEWLIKSTRNPKKLEKEFQNRFSSTSTK